MTAILSTSSLLSRVEGEISFTMPYHESVVGRVQVTYNGGSGGDNLQKDDKVSSSFRC